jgi:two-component system CheB/CheR fusion protein
MRIEVDDREAPFLDTLQSFLHDHGYNPKVAEGSSDSQVFSQDRNEEQTTITPAAKERLHKQPARASGNSEDRLQYILQLTTDAILTVDETGIVRSSNLAAEKMFGYPAAELIGMNLGRLVPVALRVHSPSPNPPAESAVRFGLVCQEGVATRKDRRRFPVELTISHADTVGLHTCIIRDVSKVKTLERRFLEAAVFEQQRIGQDLHDTVSQGLTILAIRNSELAGSIGKGPSDQAQLLNQIKQEIDRCKQQLRNIMHGLLPVTIGAHGLADALTDLASRTQQSHRVDCTFDCGAHVAVDNGRVAAQLYLIAQESVHNALVHAKPTQIRIRLRLQPSGCVKLSIEDDGTGLSNPPKGLSNSRGWGLQIMKKRAAAIGGALTIEGRQPYGTRVRCVFRTNANGQDGTRHDASDPDR